MSGAGRSLARAGNPLPLAGLRVLEFCHTIMGPSAGVLLADLGADVIKIEPAPGGDPTRQFRGFGSGFFYAFNRNKRSLAVDLKTEDGLALIHRLAGGADIVLENYAPGAMDRLGCGYETFSKINPGIIYCALKGFLSGPYEHRPALDEVVQFMAGLAYMTGPPGQPLRAGASVIDIMGGMFAVIGIQAALRERESTGAGQFIKSALFETTAFLMTQHMAGEVITGKPSPSMADHDGRKGIWGIYETFATADDELIFLGLTSDRHWRDFWHHFDRQDMIDNPNYATNPDRVQNRPEFRPIVAECLRRHTVAELTLLFDELGVPFAPVAKPGDLFDDPHLKAGGHMLDIDFPNGQSAAMPGLPIEIGDHDLSLRRQTPATGQHSREILHELGLEDAEIDDLGRRAVIAWPDGD